MKMCAAFKKLKCGSDISLLIVRLTVAAAFLLHGIAKWDAWNTVASEGMSAGLINLMRFLSVVEPLAAVGLILGLMTQLAAGGLAIIMLGAVYMKQMVWNIGYSSVVTTGWEYDLSLFALCVVLFVMGSGRFSLERLLCKKMCKGECDEGMCCKK